jgi:hypothetical protein
MTRRITSQVPLSAPPPVSTLLFSFLFSFCFRFPYPPPPRMRLWDRLIFTSRLPRGSLLYVGKIVTENRIRMKENVSDTENRIRKKENVFDELKKSYFMQIQIHVILPDP